MMILTSFSLQKGDLLIKVNENSLDGLTHSQAVATLKATINLSTVSLTIMEVSWISVVLSVRSFQFRDQRQVSEHQTSSRVGCSGRSCRDSCSTPRRWSCTEESALVGDSPSSVIKGFEVSEFSLQTYKMKGKLLNMHFLFIQQQLQDVHLLEVQCLGEDTAVIEFSSRVPDCRFNRLRLMEAVNFLDNVKQKAFMRLLSLGRERVSRLLYIWPTDSGIMSWSFDKRNAPTGKT